jgi:CRP/FNR family cyclic AMP-dependent transcriptional regulator
VESALLAGLDDVDRRELLMRARRRKFSRREIIFHEGDPGEVVHLVSSGHVGIRMTNPLGDVALVRVLRPGEFFGELALLSPGPRSASAFSIEGAETLAIARSDFDALRNKSGAVAEVLVGALAAEVRRLANAHMEALYIPADRRFYRRVLDTARLWSPDAPVAVPLTQDELAQLAGVSRPTANQLLQAARDADAIELSRGQVRVLDPKWLERKGR